MHSRPRWQVIRAVLPVPKLLGKFLSFSRTLRASRRFFELLGNLSSFSGSCRASPEPSELLQNLQSFSRTLRASPELPELLQNFPSFSRSSRASPGLSELLQNLSSFSGGACRAGCASKDVRAVAPMGRAAASSGGFYLTWGFQLGRTCFIARRGTSVPEPARDANARGAGEVVGRFRWRRGGLTSAHFHSSPA
jgi:hypothetical protein